MNRIHFSLSQHACRINDDFHAGEKPLSVLGAYGLCQIDCDKPGLRKRAGKRLG